MPPYRIKQKESPTLLLSQFLWWMKFIALASSRETASLTPVVSLVLTLCTHNYSLMSTRFMSAYPVGWRRGD